MTNKEIAAGVVNSVPADVNVGLDEEQERTVSAPVRKKRKAPGVDKAFAEQVSEFIELYRPALRELAKK